MTPRVSVIMPAHNAQRTLREAVESVRAQTLRDWELILVDDGSTDATPAILRELASLDRRITLLFQSNRGPATARNRALDIARGETVAFLDSDDWWFPDALQTLSDALKVHAQAGVHAHAGVYAHFEFADDSLRPTLLQNDFHARPLGLRDLVLGDHFPIMTWMVARQTVGARRFDESLRSWEDLDLYQQLASEGVVFQPVDRVIARYRMRPGSASRHWRNAHEGQTEVLRRGLRLLGGPSAAPHDDAAAMQRRTGLAHAAMAHLAGDEGESRRLAAEALRGKPATASEMVCAVIDLLPHQQGLQQDAWAPRFGAFFPQALRFWSMLREAGLAADDERLCRDRLLDRLDPRALVIDALEQRCIALAREGRISRVLIHALGRNGKALLRRLLARGVPTQARDDHADLARLRRDLPELQNLDDVLTTRSLPELLAEPDTLHIVSMLHDETYTNRLLEAAAPGPSPLIERWATLSQHLSLEVRHIAHAHSDRLIPTMNSDPPAAHVASPGASRSDADVLREPSRATTGDRCRLRPIDIFCASFNRAEKLSRMIESVIATGYPARVLVAAGDIETLRVCERYPGVAEGVYSSENNRRIGCTAPLNMVVRDMVVRDAIFCTDDLLFEKDCLHNAVAALDRHFPDGDGVIGLCDANIQDDYALAFPLIGRAFQLRFLRTLQPDGPLFFPRYFHMFNDAELGETLKYLGNYRHEPSARLHHFHPDFGGTMDRTHSHALTFREHDERLWNDRRNRGLLWGIDAEPMPRAAPRDARLPAAASPQPHAFASWESLDDAQLASAARTHLASWYATKPGDDPLFANHNETYDRWLGSGTDRTLVIGLGQGLESIRLAQAGTRVSIADTDAGTLAFHARLARALGLTLERTILLPSTADDARFERVLIGHAAHATSLSALLELGAGVLASGGDLRLLLSTDRAWVVTTGTDAPALEARSSHQAPFHRFAPWTAARGTIDDWFTRQKLLSQLPAGWTLAAFDLLTRRGLLAGVTLRRAADHGATGTTRSELSDAEAAAA